MVEVNEYFEGKVKSFVIESKEGKKTLGVMLEGEYEFDITSKEVMTIISGEVSIYSEEYDDWEIFGTGSSFDVPENSKLQIKVIENTAYICEYV